MGCAFFLGQRSYSLYCCSNVFLACNSDFPEFKKGMINAKIHCWPLGGFDH